MALEQSIDLALAATIGEGGVAEEALDWSLAAVDSALDRLRDDDESGRLPLLHMPRATEDLASIRQAARWLRDDASDIVFPRHRRVEPRRADAGAIAGITRCLAPGVSPRRRGSISSTISTR